MDSVDDLLEVLVANDDPEFAELPGGPRRYDRRASEARFAAFAVAVLSAAGPGARAESFPEVQDASFVGQVLLPRAVVIDEEVVALRVSHFGPFAAIVEDERAVRPDFVAQLKAIASEHSYTWIPSDVLRLPYSGQNPGVTGFRTWADRFFDWI